MSLLPLSNPAPPHKSVLVGDLKMVDFKQYLASKGVQVLDSYVSLPVLFGVFFMSVLFQSSSKSIKHSKNAKK